MDFNSFSEGILVEYCSIQGPIKFVCHRYITICINPDNIKSRQTNIIVFPENWNEIKLFKQSNK